MSVRAVFLIGYLVAPSLSHVFSDLVYPAYKPPPKPISHYSWPAKCFSTPSCDRSYPYRSIDGSCNNLWNPALGVSNTTLVRMLPAKYSDDKGSLPLAKDGQPLPLARKLRTLLFPNRNISDSINTYALMTFGQFMTHDSALLSTVRAPECCTIDGKLITNGSVPSYCLIIAIPEDDEFYQQFGQTCFAFRRGETINEKGCDTTPRQLIDLQTHFLDLSMVYGRNQKEADSLRKFSRGHLRTQEDEDGRTFLPNVDDARGRCPLATAATDTCFLAGDPRPNQQPALTVMHTIFLREHNLLCDQLSLLNPHWSDEKLYQEARRLLIAQYQHIVYEDYLPVLLGYDNARGYKLNPTWSGYGFGYDEQVNPGTLNMFTGAVYRALHSLIPSTLDFVADHGRCSGGTKDLVDVINRPDLVLEDGNLDSILRGITTQPADQMDSYSNNQLTDLLFRPVGVNFGIDLMSTDIMRGRDHGVPSYNTVRRACGLRKADNFHDFDDTMSKLAWSQLAQIYTHVDDVDLYVGVLMEDLVPGALTGKVSQCIIAEQFRRWKSGDRFFYEYGGFPGSFRLDQLEEIRKTSLSLLMCRNSDHIKRIQKDAFSQLSSRNSYVKCNQIPSLNLRLWKESTDNYHIH